MPLDNLTEKSLMMSINSYYDGREKKTTLRYFIYNNKQYPIMNIIRNAIIYYNKSGPKNMIVLREYNKIHNCKRILEKFLGTIEYIKLNND